MSDLVSARAATGTDVPLTSSMAGLAKDEVIDERGGRWLLEHDLAQGDPAARHREALASPTHCLVVGEIDGTVVGYAYSLVSPAASANLCMVEELFVRAEARGIGVGAAMLGHIRRWAVAQGCVAIESHVLPGNRSGKNFFERVGMVTRKMRVSAELTD